VALDGLAAATADGRIWVVGGLVDGTTSTDAVAAWRPGQRSWRRMGRLPFPRHDGAAVAVRGEVWFVGGGLGSVSARQAVAFAASGDGGLRERPLPTLSVARSDLAAATLGATAYVAGGYDGYRLATQVLALRPGGRRWRTVARLGQGARYAALVAVGGRLYRFGGMGANGEPLANIWAVDPATGKVRLVGRLPVPTRYLVAAVLDGQVFLLGGETAAGPTAAIWRFDPVNGRVSAAGRLPSPRAYGAAVVWRGTVVVLGGEGPQGPLASVVRLRPVAGRG
jgi:N-acetylneuraminic acid mutarotase